MKTTIRNKNEFRALDKHITDGKEYNVSIMATKNKPGITLEKLAMTVEKLTQIVIEGFARQEEWNRKQEKFNEMIFLKVTKIEGDVVELKQDVALIKQCPTIKKELAEINKLKK